MRAALKVLALSVALSVAACASKPPPELREDGIPFRELPRQTLKPGACAMFLWTPDGDAARRIMAVTPAPTVARVKLRQRSFSFAAVHEEGERLGGLAPRMRFEGFGAAIALDLSFRRRDTLAQGFLVERGTLTYTAANGWSATLPVAGVVACEPERR